MATWYTVYVYTVLEVFYAVRGKQLIQESKLSQSWLRVTRYAVKIFLKIQDSKLSQVLATRYAVDNKFEMARNNFHVQLVALYRVASYAECSKCGRVFRN